MENIWGKASFEQRVASHLKSLSEKPARVVVELAATVPGCSMDAPFAPVDPALNAAARQLVEQVGLGDRVQLLKQS